jgi:hypothetical protein
MPSPQARYYLLTIPHEAFTPYLPPGTCWIKGQLEQGEQGFLHWQLVVAYTKKTTLSAVRAMFGPYHAEATRSAAAEEYVHKEETAVIGTRFELGSKATKRNSEKDWDKIWDDSRTGNMLAIPADIRIRCYSTLKRIKKDYEVAPFREDVVCHAFWGVTHSGKSHRMFTEAYDGQIPYVKQSTTKWWDGYTGQTHVIIDEFRGQIAVEHLLKWLDKYPCFVEEKGGQVALCATHFWITSNINPILWYPSIDEGTRDAMLRRLRVTHFPFAHR